MRCTLVLLFFLAAVACRKGKVENEIQEPLDLNAADEIAYIVKKGNADGFQLFLMKADGSGLRALSGDSIANEPLAVSHDGNRFLFSTLGKSRIGRLYVVDKRGGEAVLLASDTVFYSNMSWSPDDRKILFQKWTLGMGNASNIFVMDSDGRNEKQLTIDGRSSYPHWFPDGRKIIYNAANNNPGVYIMGADGSNAWRLGLIGATYANAILSPAGDKIAMYFVSQGNERSLLYVMNADGTGIKEVVVAPPPTVPSASIYYRIIELSPAWSPDGTKIAYACRVGDNSEIFVVNSDGTENKRLTKTNKLESNPVWSKDGRHIIYLANDPEDYDPKIYIMRANGHSPTQISNTDGFIMYPSYIGQ